MMSYTSFHCLHTLIEHAGSAKSIAISPDGQTLFSGSRDKTVKVWSLITGQLQQTWVRHHNDVTAIALSPDGQTLASSGVGRVFIWDVPSSQLRLELENPHPHYTRDVETRKFCLDQNHPENGLQGWTQSLSFSAKTGLVYAATIRNNLYCWDSQTGKYLSRLSFDRHNGTSRFAMSRDGQMLVGIHTGTLKAWNLSSENNFWLFRTETDHATFCVALSHDTQVIATGGVEGTIYLWDLHTGGSLGGWQGHSG